MTEQRASANDTGLPDEAIERLRSFAASTGTTPPERLTQDDGDGITFSDDLLDYCNRTGFSLDWLMRGKGVVTYTSDGISIEIDEDKGVFIFGGDEEVPVQGVIDAMADLGYTVTPIKEGGAA